jgi:hypothetical protein
LILHYESSETSTPVLLTSSQVVFISPSPHGHTTHLLMRWREIYPRPLVQRRYGRWCSACIPDRNWAIWLVEPAASSVEAVRHGRIIWISCLAVRPIVVPASLREVEMTKGVRQRLDRAGLASTVSALLRPRRTSFGSDIPRQLHKCRDNRLSLARCAARHPPNL